MKTRTTRTTRAAKRRMTSAEARDRIKELEKRAEVGFLRRDEAIELQRLKREYGRAKMSSERGRRARASRKDVIDDALDRQYLTDQEHRRLAMELRSANSISQMERIIDEWADTLSDPEGLVDDLVEAMRHDELSHGRHRSSRASARRSARAADMDPRLIDDLLSDVRDMERAADSALATSRQLRDAGFPRSADHFEKVFAGLGRKLVTIKEDIRRAGKHG